MVQTPQFAVMPPITKLLWPLLLFLDPEGGSPNATLVVVVLVVISSVKVSKAFLMHSARNFAYTFVLMFPTDAPSQILKLISN